MARFRSRLTKIRRGPLVAGLFLLAFTMVAPGAASQEVFGPALPSNDDGDSSLIDLDVNLGGDKPTKLSGSLEIVIIITLLSFIPSLLVSVTSFARIAIVLGFVRRAMGVQDMPPTMVMVGLTVFVTAAIMYPTFEKVYDEAYAPYKDGTIGFTEAGERATDALRGFLIKHAREDDILLFLELSDEPPPPSPEELSLRILIPSFMLSEIKTAFQMGFVVYLPFLIIDLVIASVLLSMGMMMLPPIMISTPFKILLFILVDGWHLVLRSLAESFMV